MPDVLQILLSHGSIGLVVLALIVAGLGLPVPEDIMLLAAGVLVHRGEVSFVGALGACAFGVLVGDTTIFLIARRLGPAALVRRPLRWLVTPSRRIQIEQMFQKRGNTIVFMGRHMAGLRAPIFAMAGINGVKLRNFWLWDGLGLCVSAPVVIGIGYALAEELPKARAHLHQFETVVLVVLGLAIVGFVVYRKLRKARAIEEG
ncbi:MAG: DedA family protein [Myxococcaceae bacterium]|nr:DedA family protein [Myxococcaceae bacterium]